MPTLAQLYINKGEVKSNAVPRHLTILAAKCKSSVEFVKAVMK